MKRSDEIFCRKTLNENHFIITPVIFFITINNCLNCQFKAKDSRTPPYQHPETKKWSTYVLYLLKIPPFRSDFENEIKYEYQYDRYLEI